MPSQMAFNPAIHAPFPATTQQFPRSDWNGVIWSARPIRNGRLDAKARWAARCASRKWQAAFDSSDMDETLDEVDFAVATFDVAYRMYASRWPGLPDCADCIAQEGTHAHPHEAAWPHRPHARDMANTDRHGH